MPPKKVKENSVAVKMKNLKCAVKTRNNEGVKKRNPKTKAKISKCKTNRKLLNALGPSIVKVKCKIPEIENTVKNILPYTQETLEDCLKAIMKKEITQKYACEHYHIPKSTLYSKLKALKNSAENLPLELPLVLNKDENDISIQSHTISDDSPDGLKKLLNQDNTNTMTITKKPLEMENNHLIKTTKKEIKKQRNRSVEQERRNTRNSTQNSAQKDKKKEQTQNNLCLKIKEKPTREKNINKKQVQPKPEMSTLVGIKGKKKPETEKSKVMNLSKTDSCPTDHSSPRKPKSKFQLTRKEKSLGGPGKTKTIKSTTFLTEVQDIDDKVVDPHITSNIVTDVNENIEECLKKIPEKIRTPKIDEKASQLKEGNKLIRDSNLIKTLDSVKSIIPFVHPVVRKETNIVTRGNQSPNTQTSPQKQNGIETPSKYEENIQRNTATVTGLNEFNLSVSPIPISAENKETNPPTPGMSWANDISSSSVSLMTVSEKIIPIDGKLPYVGLTDCITYKEHNSEFFSSIGLTRNNLDSTSSSSMSNQQMGQDNTFEDVEEKRTELSSSSTSSSSSGSSSTSSSTVSSLHSNRPHTPPPAHAVPCSQEEEKSNERMRKTEKIQNLLANFDFSSWIEQIRKTASNVANEIRKIDEKKFNSLVSEIPLLRDYKPLISANENTVSKSQTSVNKTNFTITTTHTGTLKKPHSFPKPQNVKIQRKSTLNKSSPFATSLLPSQLQRTKVYQESTNNKLLNLNENSDLEPEDDDDALSLYADSISFSESFSRFRDTNADSEKSNTPSSPSCHSHRNQTIDRAIRIDFNQELPHRSCNKSPISFEAKISENVIADCRDTMDATTSKCLTQNKSSSERKENTKLQKQDMQPAIIVNHFNTHGIANDYERYVLSLTQLTDKGKLFKGVCFYYQTNNCLSSRCTYPHRLLLSADIESRLYSYDTQRVIHEYLCIKKHDELYLRFFFIFHNIFKDRNCSEGIELLAYDNYSVYPNPTEVCNCVRLLSENKRWRPSALLGIIVHDACAVPPPVLHHTAPHPHAPVTPHVSTARRTLADVLLQVALYDMNLTQTDHLSTIMKLGAYLKGIHRRLETNTTITILELVTNMNINDSNILHSLHQNVVLNSNICELEEMPNQCLQKFKKMLLVAKQDTCRNTFDKSVDKYERLALTPVIRPATGYIGFPEQDKIQTRNCFSQYSSKYEDVANNVPMTRISDINIQKERINPWEINSSAFKNSNVCSPNFNAVAGGPNVPVQMLLNHQFNNISEGLPNKNLFQNNFVWQQNLVEGIGSNNQLSPSPQTTCKEAQNISNILPLLQMFQPNVQWNGQGTKMQNYAHNNINPYSKRGRFARAKKFQNVDVKKGARFGPGTQKCKPNDHFGQS